MLPNVTQLELERSHGDTLTIWFNRFPPAHLEGHEHLIQDPHKLEDEVRGRRQEFEALLAEGTPLRCCEPGRCALCYLQPFCRELDDTRRRLDRGGFDFLRVRADRPASTRPRCENMFSGVWIRAANLQAAAALGGLPGAKLILELDDYAGLAESLEGERALGKTLARAHARCPRELERLLSIPGRFEVV
ncbi:MAG: hypothetical protein ACK2U9_23075, partial [Anaerolineae bacterium]